MSPGRRRRAVAIATRSRVRFAAEEELAAVYSALALPFIADGSWLTVELPKKPVLCLSHDAETNFKPYQRHCDRHALIIVASSSALLLLFIYKTDGG